MAASKLPSLLFLTSPPKPPSRDALDFAYQTPLKEALLALKDPKGSSQLVVCVLDSVLWQTAPGIKGLAWDDAQLLLANLYGVISSLCARLKIATDTDAEPGSVDVTILIVDYDRDGKFDGVNEPLDGEAALQPNNTTIVDLGTFAATSFPWQTIFSVRSDEADRVMKVYHDVAETRWKGISPETLVIVDGGLTVDVHPGGSGEERGNEVAVARQATKTYEVVCLGGTFDHLHPGHKLLLTAAALLLAVPTRRLKEGPPCTLIVGITGDELLRNKKYAEYLQSWDERAEAVLNFLATILELDTKGRRQPRETQSAEPPGQGRVEGELEAIYRNGSILVRCVRIHDAFGPTITIQAIGALVVSRETRSGGAAVNDARRELGWSELDTYEVGVLNASETNTGDMAEDDFSAKISSTAIREQRARKQQPRA